MELALVIIGLFIVAAITRDDDMDSERQTLLAGASLYLILAGLGFLFPSSTALFPNYSFLILFFVGCASMSINSNGPARVITRVGWAAILSFIILGSFR